MLKKYILLALVVLIASCETKKAEDKTAKEPQEITLYTHRHYDSDKLIFGKFEKATGIKIVNPGSRPNLSGCGFKVKDNYCRASPDRSGCCEPHDFSLIQIKPLDSSPTSFFYTGMKNVYHMKVCLEPGLRELNEPRTIYFFSLPPPSNSVLDEK